MFDFNAFKIKDSFLLLISKINIKLLITLICFVFIGFSIYGNFDDLTSLRITLKELIWLLGGILFAALSIIINAYAWKLLINSIGCNSNQLNIIKIFINTNIYKYLPGGIWHFVSRYKILRLKFSAKKSVESILLEPLLMLVAGLIWVPSGSLNISVFVLCWSSTLILLPAFREYIIKKFKVMKTSVFYNTEELNVANYVDNNQSISTKMFYPYTPLFVEIIFVLFRFLGFLCCLNAFSIGSLISQGELISCFSLAWVIGLIVPAAPGGLGVFESMILFGLGSQLPEGPLLATLLCYRLVSTLADILGAVVYPVKGLFRV